MRNESTIIEETKMAKKDVSQGITRVTPNLAVPDYMRDEQVTGLESLKEFIVPPFIKMIQKSASDELLQSFSAGDVILSPANALIAELPRNDKGRVIEGAKASFQIVPIFFYPEWITWNPIQLKGTEPSIIYRTVDPNDPIVAKSRSNTLRSEQHPTQPEYTIRHVEHLNFIVLLQAHELGAEPAVLSFSRGEWRSGTKFAALIRMRKAPIYGCVFEATVGLRHNPKGDWYGLDMSNPNEGSPWVAQEDYAKLKELHESFVGFHKEQKLQAQYDVTPEEDDAATEATNDF